MAPTQSADHNKKKFLRQVARTINDHGMFVEGDSVLVGVSGGADSTALLHALTQLTPRFSIRLGIAHLNHGLRKGAADEDEAFVASQALALRLPFFTKKTDVKALHYGTGLSLEEVARKIRYDFFFEILRSAGFSKLALGHHRDDNAELILMNLIRGSGILGLAGIPAVRENRIIRPLMNSSKRDILAFLDEQRLPFVTDASNQDRRFLRNRVRHELMPLLASAYNPRMAETLNRLGNILRDENAWAEERTKVALNALLSKGRNGSLALSISGLGGMPVAAKRRLVRAVLQQLVGGLRRISLDHIEAILKLSCNITGDGTLNLPDGVLVEHKADKLYFNKTGDKRPRPKSRLETKKGAIESRLLFPDGFEPIRLRLEGLGLEIRFTRAETDELNIMKSSKGRIVYFDLDQLHFPMILRNARPGDLFQPLGMSGHQKIKKFLINNKVPRAERAACLVLESRGKIIWLLGYRIDDSVKITPNTSQAVKAELLLAD